MESCRHFRFELPRELADKLRDADLEPCPVCDALPHRKALLESAFQTMPARVSVPAINFSAKKSSTPIEIGWLNVLLTFVQRQRQRG